jgi:ribosomal protein S19
MSRSKWKGNFIDNALFKQKGSDLNRLPKIWSRRSVISSFFLNKKVLIYTGKEFKKILITRDKIGYKFGALCFTRKHKAKLKIKK